MVKDNKKRIFAGVAIAGIFCFAIIFLGISFVLNSSDGQKQLRALESGAQFLGTDEVVLQPDRNGCGPAVLMMVFNHYRISSSLSEIEQTVGTHAKGLSMLALKQIAELKGLEAQGYRYTFSELSKAPMPAILFVRGDHFVIVDSIDPMGAAYMRDPSVGRTKVSQRALANIWKGETLVFQK